MQIFVVVISIQFAKYRNIKAKKYKIILIYI